MLWQLLNRLKNLRLRQNRSEEAEEVLIRRAEILEAFRASPAYKEVLDLLESFAEESLSELRQDRKHDPMNSMCLQLRWQERESILQRLQEEIIGPIETRKRLMEEQKDDSDVTEVSKWLHQQVPR